MNLKFSLKNGILLLIVFSMLVSYVGCGSYGYNEPGETTERDVLLMEKQIVRKKLLESTGLDTFEDCVSLLFAYEGLIDGYYYKWYSPDCIYCTNGEEFYNNFDGTTITYYYDFEDSSFGEEMKEILQWLEEYFNSLNLYINIHFEKYTNCNVASSYDGTYNFISDKYPEGYMSTSEFESEYSFASTSDWDWNVSINTDDDIPLFGIAYNKVNICLQPKLKETKKTEERERVLLHELGHSLGLSDVYARGINKDEKDFRGQTIMYAYEEDNPVKTYEGHAAYFTIDYAALDLLYGSYFE